MQAKQAADTLMELCVQHVVNVIAIGNGVGRYEAQKVVDLAVGGLPGDVQAALVSEAGASVYSVSKLAQEEYPGDCLASLHHQPTCLTACTILSSSIHSILFYSIL
jgi:transcriptional accessory protein Tex/SPT6